MSAIIEVREVLDGSALSQSRDGSRSRTRTYLVETDGTASMDDVTSASDGITSIPAWGDPYISPTGTLDASIVATEKRVSSRAPTIYRVEVIYDSQVTNAGSSSVPAGGTAQFGEGGLDSLAGTDGADGSGEGDLAQEGGEAGGAHRPHRPRSSPTHWTGLQKSAGVAGRKWSSSRRTRTASPSPTVPGCRSTRR